MPVPLIAYWEGVLAFPEPYYKEAGLDFMAKKMAVSWQGHFLAVLKPGC